MSLSPLYPLSLSLFSYPSLSLSLSLSLSHFSLSNLTVSFSNFPSLPSIYLLSISLSLSYCLDGGLGWCWVLGADATKKIERWWLGVDLGGEICICVLSGLQKKKKKKKLKEKSSIQWWWVCLGNK
ncbi:hypothetical protein ACOSP7_028904 [Xanthoceras sorbifolium]